MRGCIPSNMPKQYFEKIEDTLLVLVIYTHEPDPIVLLPPYPFSIHALELHLAVPSEQNYL